MLWDRMDSAAISMDRGETSSRVNLLALGAHLAEKMSLSRCQVSCTTSSPEQRDRTSPRRRQGRSSGLLRGGSDGSSGRLSGGGGGGSFLPSAPLPNPPRRIGRSHSTSIAWVRLKALQQQRRAPIRQAAPRAALVLPVRLAHCSDLWGVFSSIQRAEGAG